MNIKIKKLCGNAFVAIFNTGFFDSGCGGIRYLL
jgi:uncharacterized membrane protein